jgi:hypothetical protein
LPSNASRISRRKRAAQSDIKKRMISREAVGLLALV